MVPVSPWLAILGIGEDGVEGLSPQAQRLLGDAQTVFGGARHLALAQPLIRGDHHVWPSPISDAFPAIVAHRFSPVAVLASGDPFCFGIGASLARIVTQNETTCVPALSAFTLACARLCWPSQETATLSLCGRPLAALIPRLQPGARILALSADATTPAAVAALLCARGFGGSVLHVLEALGGARERIRRLIASDGMPDGIDPLNLLAIEVVASPGARVLPLAAGLPDDYFEHDGQLTKREIRAVTLSSLAPLQGGLLWDIGCGSGSIGIEWRLCHPANRAIGIEAVPERAARAARNAEALGVPDLAIVTGHAPEVLAGLPAPDAVFLGGGAQTPGLLDTAWEALRAGGRIVANAVTIETQMVLMAACRARGGTLARLGIERMDNVGTMHAFRPAMTVTQWAAVKP